MHKLQLEADSEGVSIAQAFEELPTATFAMWIRMMSESSAVLKKETVEQLAERFGCSDVWLSHVLTVLKRTGYIRVTTKANGRHQFYFAKRPMLLSPNLFVKF